MKKILIILITFSMTLFSCSDNIEQENDNLSQVNNAPQALFDTAINLPMI